MLVAFVFVEQGRQNLDSAAQAILDLTLRCSAPMETTA